MTGNTNCPYSIFFEQTRFENLKRALDFSNLRSDISTNNENLSDAGITGKPTKEVVEHRPTFDTTCNDVRDWFYSFCSQARGKTDAVLKIGSRNVHNI